MKTKRDDFYTIKPLKNGYYSLTIRTDKDLAVMLRRLIKEDKFNERKFEEMMIFEYGCYYPGWDCYHNDDDYDEDINDSNELDGYLEAKRDCEIVENDKRVVNQYDENNFELLEWVKYYKYMIRYTLNPGHKERLWKLNIIRKIMKGK